MLAALTIFYLLITVATGILAARKISGAGDFALAGRSLPFHLSLASFFATWFGAETILGASSQFAKHGFAGIIEDPFGASFCLIITGLVFVKYFYPKGYFSIGDFFREKYGPDIEFCTSLLQALSYFTYTAAQFIALAIVLQTVTDLSFAFCLVIGATLVVLYTYFGGMWALAYTDFIQAIVIIAGLLILAIFLMNLMPQNGSVFSLIKEGGSIFPENNFTGWAEFSAAWMVMGLGSIPSQDIFQRIMSARSLKVAKWSAVSAGVLYLLIAMLPIIILLMCFQIYGNGSQSSQHIIPFLVLNHMPLFIQVLFFGALLSAILSTASASILAQATVIGENLVKPFLKNTDNTQLLTLLRICVLIVSAISVIIALLFESIFILTSVSSSVILVTLFIPMAAGIWLKTPERNCAWASITGGLVTYLLCHLFETELMAVFYGFFASAGSYLTCSAINRKFKQTDLD